METFKIPEFRVKSTKTELPNPSLFSLFLRGDDTCFVNPFEMLLIRLHLYAVEVDAEADVFELHHYY